MPTPLGQLISEVREDVRAVGIDTYLPARYLHQKLKHAASIIIKNQSDSRRIFNLPDIFLTIKCLRMIPYTLQGFITLDSCTGLRMSEKELPEFYGTAYNYLLDVSTILVGKGTEEMRPQKFEQSSPNDYRLILGSRFKPRKNWFWIEDKRLIITDENIEYVRLRGLFSDLVNIKDLDVCADEETSSNDCSILSKPFPCPEYLLADVKRLVVSNLLQRVQIPADENPNQNENIKT